MFKEPVRHVRMISAACVLALLGGLGLEYFDNPTPFNLTVKNGARVYFPSDLSTGDKVEKKKPGIISSRRVFDATPEYADIRRRALDQNSAEYLLLLKKASDRFQIAVTRCVDRGSYDLIAEQGAVSVESGEIPDITDEVIKGL
ncbi:MAG: hypothetical protein EXS14_08335 [Planctomycetes bacterium]|nr:hypothetical protein [Planctomycetota bacterium]